MQRRNLLAAAAAATLIPVGFAKSARQQSLSQDGVAWFTNVPVRTHDGRTLRFYDDVLRGKIVLINFFFTGCDAICPLMTANLARVQDLLGDRMGRTIFMVSITLQPEADTPETLGGYAKTYGAGPGWVFLTGKRADIELLRHRLGFVDSDPSLDADLEQHIGMIRIANEPMHRWSASPALVDPAAIVRTVKRVIPET